MTDAEKKRICIKCGGHWPQCCLQEEERPILTAPVEFLNASWKPNTLTRYIPVSVPSERARCKGVDEGALPEHVLTKEARDHIVREFW